MFSARSGAAVLDRDLHLGDAFRDASNEGRLRMAGTGVLAVGTAGTKLHPHGFYGPEAE